MTDHRGDLSLARPPVLLGLDSVRVTTEAISQLLERDGREYRAAKRPKGMRKGRQGACYRNATRLVMDHRLSGGTSLDYVEGILRATDSPFGFLHAWAVTADGTVIDPTIKDPESYTYFGIAHDWDAYTAYAAKTGFYGILGGDDAALAEWLTAKGIAPLQMDPRFAEFLKATEGYNAAHAARP